MVFWLKFFYTTPLVTIRAHVCKRLFILRKGSMDNSQKLFSALKKFGRPGFCVPSLCLRVTAGAGFGVPAPKARRECSTLPPIRWSSTLMRILRSRVQSHTDIRCKYRNLKSITLIISWLLFGTSLKGYKKDVLISFFRFEELRDLFLREYASATQDSFPESQIDFRSSVLPRPWLMPFMCGS